MKPKSRSSDHEIVFCPFEKYFSHWLSHTGIFEAKSDLGLSSAARVSLVFLFLHLYYHIDIAYKISLDYYASLNLF